MEDRARRKPFIWVTWLSKALANDNGPCLWGFSHRANFAYTKRPDENFDSIGWKAAHRAAVMRYADKLIAEGWDVSIEDQNSIKVKGVHAILSGQPDIVAIKPGQVKTVDIKGGEKRDEHWWQVAIYMNAWPILYPNEQNELTGEIVYDGKQSAIIPITQVEAEAKKQLMWDMVKKLATQYFDLQPEPSAKACKFCDLNDCTARWLDVDSVMMSTENF